MTRSKLIVVAGLVFSMLCMTSRLAAATAGGGFPHRGPPKRIIPCDHDPTEDCSFHSIQHKGHYNTLTGEMLSEETAGVEFRKFSLQQQGAEGEDEETRTRTSWHSVEYTAKLHKDWNFVTVEDHFPTTAPLRSTFYRRKFEDYDYHQRDSSNHHGDAPTAAEDLLQKDTRLVCRHPAEDSDIHIRHDPHVHGTDSSHVENLHRALNSLPHHHEHHTVLVSDNHHCSGEPLLRRVHNISLTEGEEEFEEYHSVDREEEQGDDTTTSRSSTKWWSSPSALFTTKKEQVVTKRKVKRNIKKLTVKTSSLTYQDIFHSADIRFVGYNPAAYEPSSKAGSNTWGKAGGDIDLETKTKKRKKSSSSTVPKEVAMRGVKRASNKVLRGQNGFYETLMESDHHQEEGTVGQGHQDEAYNDRRQQQQQRHVMNLQSEGGSGGIPDQSENSVHQSGGGSTGGSGGGDNNNPPSSGGGSGGPFASSGGGSGTPPAGSNSLDSGGGSNHGGGGSSSLTGGSGSNGGGTFPSSTGSAGGSGSDHGGGSFPTTGAGSTSTGGGFGSDSFSNNGGGDFSFPSEGSDGGGDFSFPSETGGSGSTATSAGSTGADTPAPVTPPPTTATGSGGDLSDSSSSGPTGPAPTGPSWYGKDTSEAGPLRDEVASAFEMAADAEKRLEADQTDTEQLAPIGTQNPKATFSVGSLNSNGDVTKKFDIWNLDFANSVAQSFNFQGRIVFSLKIVKYEMEFMEAFWEGQVKLGVKGKFGGAAQRTVKESEKADPIAAASYKFSISGVPVAIDPGVNLYTGYDHEVGGVYEYQIVYAGEGYIKQGFINDTAQGAVPSTNSFQPLSVADLEYVKDISPRDYRYDMGLGLYMGANLNLQISFVGGPRNALRMTGLMFLSQSDQCRVMNQFQVQLVQAISVLINIKAGDATINGERTFFPPIAVSVTQKPLFNLCYPWVIGGSSNQQHKMLEQQDDVTLPPTPAPAAGVNNVKVVETPIYALTYNNTGMSWEGYTEGNGCGIQRKVSLQFVIGSSLGQSLFALHIANNKTSRTSRGIRLPNSFQQFSVLLSVYQQPVAGTVNGQLTTLLLNETASGVPTMDPPAISSLPETVKISFNPNGADRVTVASDALLCGSVTLSTPSFTNDNLTFGYLVQVQPTPLTFFEKLKALAVFATNFIPSIIICAAGLLAGVCICYSRGRRRREYYREAHLRNTIAKMSDKDESPEEQEKRRRARAKSIAQQQRDIKKRAKSDFDDDEDEEMTHLTASDGGELSGEEKKRRCMTHSIPMPQSSNSPRQSPRREGGHFTDNPDDDGVYMPPTPAFMLRKDLHRSQSIKYASGPPAAQEEEGGGRPPQSPTADVRMNAL